MLVKKKKGDRQERDWSTLENDGRLMDSGQTRSSSGPNPIPPLPFEGARIQRERIAKQDIDEFRTTVGCTGCNTIKDNTRAQAHSDGCGVRIEQCLRITRNERESD